MYDPPDPDCDFDQWVADEVARVSAASDAHQFHLLVAAVNAACWESYFQAMKDRGVLTAKIVDDYDFEVGMYQGFLDGIAHWWPKDKTAAFFQHPRH